MMAEMIIVLFTWDPKAHGNILLIFLFELFFFNQSQHRTPFHSDVLGTFSWSTNIVGRKKWLLLIPGEECKLFDRFGQTPFTIDEDCLQANDVRYFLVHQDADETLFVPSGWWHQVWNESDTISVNHNWLNACNVRAVWTGICENYTKVLREIDDCRDMDGFEAHCQLMLRATHGMNFVDFLNMLVTVAERRICGHHFDGFVFGQQHCKLDLNTICTIVEELRQKFDKDYLLHQVERCVSIVRRIKYFLATYTVIL